MVQKILIVCGAGASSTFLAHRLRAGAKERGITASFRSESLPGLADSLPGSDLLLVGPHLESRFDELRHQAARVGVGAALLPHDVFGGHGADAVLDTLPILLSARAVAAESGGDTSVQTALPGAEPDSGHH
ncbi:MULTISPECIES: PTS sugar transporter subunit IIB [unclassified Rathayibacter]|uniref:PTS sugar transporter subunit IIB n=1 Tax=unclassified Rathayibacter TaxID=2609250 RepID=UPI000700FD47|nr:MULTISPECIES: hypothetical protein [unclassified Rathayibacter]KQQ05220.1 hypothetical protein ASF42_00955 [Rathayibacter sp. Leaf294]KQS13083.1 hypothetical protein ASG06_00955 [Rathayibacter sp. Leaf185]